MVLNVITALNQSLRCPKTYTKPYTFFACVNYYSLLSDIYVSSVPLKMRFRKECPFESGQGHHFLFILIANPFASLRGGCGRAVALVNPLGSGERYFSLAIMRCAHISEGRPIGRRAVALANTLGSGALFFLSRQLALLASPRGRPFGRRAVALANPLGSGGYL